MYALLLITAALGAAPEAQWLGEPPKKAERIVSLAPSATELIFAMGAGERVVGVTRYDDVPKAVLKLPKVGGFIDPNHEAIFALKPDFVVAVPTSGGRKALDDLARLGVPVLVLPGLDLAEIWLSIDALGRTLGMVVAADALKEKLQAQRQKLIAQHRGKKSIKALVVVGLRPIVAIGPGSYLHAGLADIAVENAVTLDKPYPVLDPEFLFKLDPDVIVDLSYGPGSGPEAWHAVADLRAVRDKRVVKFDDDALRRPGPRLFAGLARLAAALEALRR